MVKTSFGTNFDSKIFSRNFNAKPLSCLSLSLNWVRSSFYTERGGKKVFLFLSSLSLKKFTQFPFVLSLEKLLCLGER